MLVEMYCIDDAATPLVIPQTDGYTDAGTQVPLPPMYCSAGNRICGVRTQISNTDGMKAVEFACCK